MIERKRPARHNGWGDLHQEQAEVAKAGHLPVIINPTHCNVFLGGDWVFYFDTPNIHNMFRLYRPGHMLSNALLTSWWLWPQLVRQRVLTSIWLNELSKSDKNSIRVFYLLWISYLDINASCRSNQLVRKGTMRKTARVWKMAKSAPHCYRHLPFTSASSSKYCQSLSIAAEVEIPQLYHI